ncbi:hypothetical protein [Wolbachia endosymbiont (group A) of Anomoia purmunda]|nr:hypothetical protein [Wolbachia endosymbiont (group A) of Anomoia purmunda]
MKRANRNQGKKGWVVTNKTATLMKLVGSRGKKVLKGLLPEY